MNPNRVSLIALIPVAAVIANCTQVPMKTATTVVKAAPVVAHSDTVQKPTAHVSEQNAKAPQATGDAPKVHLATPKAFDVAFVEIRGTFQYTVPIRAQRVLIADATIKCTRGQPLRIEAETIEWSGKIAFDCRGDAGANGSDGVTWRDRGWCVGENQGNWYENFRNGGNEAGGNGTNGRPGQDGSAIDIIADRDLFAEGSTIEFDARGGDGGHGGKGGEGRSKASAPSGDDCSHGTNLRHQTHAPNGVDGLDGPNGSNGSVNMQGVAFGATPAIHVMERK